VLKTSVPAVFQLGVLGYPQADSFSKTPAKALNPAASMPPKARG